MDNIPTVRTDISGKSASASSLNLAAMLWYALSSVPFAPNPFLEKAFDEVNVEKVPAKWQAELQRRLDPMGAYTAGNFLGSLSNYLTFKGLESIGRGAMKLSAGPLGRGRLAIMLVEAYTLTLIEGLVMVDMAFEDGL